MGREHWKRGKKSRGLIILFSGAKHGARYRRSRRHDLRDIPQRRSEESGEVKVDQEQEGYHNGYLNVPARTCEIMRGNNKPIGLLQWSS
ncbi:hypothetical protein BCON_0148g00090 [Botryotinia convoluta]|uniref:Uncharacterized protein n=1 Tax=Botryotinia convoluta TaxID=54673 RepID=A0A4Z1HTI5_9HELO|nr:hypothetical protein BCON_0148g00090 [Botryotinia convoluta]